ncbi:MAG: preprotein translocase subunit SecE [Gemmatimonadales bacterium]|nr:preprotein translocase subunit SecE [Gemmatimonadales bacterium]
MSETLPVESQGGGRVGTWLRTARDFFVSVKGEMQKVTWPTQAELIKATRMVVVLSLIIGIALGLLDRLLQLILVDGVAALAR